MKQNSSQVGNIFSLSDMQFLVTGGTRGIGRAISVQFARAGASVIANYVRDVKSAEKLQDEAAAENLIVDLCRADLTSPKGLERLADCLNKFDKLDGLVHCAATGVHKTLEDLTVRHLDWTFSLNVRAFFEVVQMIRSKLGPGSSILAVSSMGAARAVPSYSVIGSSKGALEAFARNISVELAEKGIRVNILRPGTVLTDSWNSMPDADARLEQAKNRSPIKRLVTAEEVAIAAQFLCSNAAVAIVGHTLVVDGGIGIVE